MFFIGRTDTRSTQNYSSEPHNKQNIIFKIWLNSFDFNVALCSI